MTGHVLWYRVDVTAPSAPSGLGLPLTLSNDMLAGGLVLDADVTVTMTEGAATDAFELALINLPVPAADLIRAVQASTPLTVSIRLGYFDDPATRTGDGGLVLAGRVTRVSGCVGADGYARTVLHGQEEAGYRLRNTPAGAGRPGTTSALLFAGELARAAGVTVAPGSTLPGDLTGFTVRSGSTLDALRALADRAAAPLVVRDGKVLLGAAVGAQGDQAPVSFTPDTNIVSLDTATGEDTAGVPSPPLRNTLCLTVLGDPRLRVGQLATIGGLAGVPAGPLRLSRVVHRFTTTGGYAAELGLIAAGPGERGQIAVGVQVVVDRWRDLVDRARDDHPAIDVGEVSRYASGADGKHVASLHYGQTPDPAVTAPSVGSPVGPDVVLHEKPVAAVFAFDRTGLVVPVYPGMRALLAHQGGAVNDAVVAGFLWPDNPRLRRPANQPGDYWLALPTGLDTDGLPTGPGANDLIDAAGRRVIQATGLHVLVGTDAAPEVGTRPDPPDPDTIVIEHGGGTKITVDATGAVTISTDHQRIRLTNGQVKLDLDGATVAVS